MKYSDLPAVILVATIWSYWFGIGVMIVRARRKTRDLKGLVPEQEFERAMWVIWIPLVIAWIVLPWLALRSQTRCSRCRSLRRRNLFMRRFAGSLRRPRSHASR